MDGGGYARVMSDGVAREANYETTPAEAQELQLATELSARLKAEGVAGADWADVPCCLRFVRARKGKPAAAEAMLRESLRWRAAFGADTLSERHAEIRQASLTGKVRVSPCRDHSGRPVLVLTPREENQRYQMEDNLVNLVYHLERLGGGRPGVSAYPSPEPSPDGKAVVVMDFRGYSMFNSPPMRASKASLAILQNHYPERLSKFVLLNSPALFLVFFRAISPFIDPVTRSKVQFVSGSAATQRETLAEHFDLEELEESLGGRKPYVYQVDEYLGADPGMPKTAANAAGGGEAVGGLDRGHGGGSFSSRPSK